MRESENHKLSTKNNKEKQRTHIEFRMNLAHQLLGGFTGKRKRTPDIQPPAQLQQHCVFQLNFMLYSQILCTSYLQSIIPY
jgi:hypothetical protein